MLLALALLEIGALLIYAGVTGRSPVALLLGSNQDNPTAKGKAASPTATPPRSVTQGSGQFGTQRGQYQRG